jgi:hypothetical protein
MKKTPLAQVKELGGKETLVDKLVDLVPRDEDEDKNEFRQRLMSMANSKLLRMHRVHNEVQSRFGNKDGLVDALVALMKRSKDNDYAEKLRGYTATRLLSLHVTWEKKAKKAS